MPVFPAAALNYDKNSEFSGIFYHTYYKTGIFSLNGDFKITASSYKQGSIYCIVGVDNSNNNNFFQTDNIQNSWIQFELNNIKISVSSFIYRAREPDFHDNWQLLGSNDNETFDILYEGKTESYTNQHSLINKNFNCTNENIGKRYSLIRLKSNGQRSSYWDSRFILPIYRFEVFGNIYSIAWFTQQRKLIFPIFCFITIFILL